MIRKTFKWMLLTGAVLGGTGFLFLGTAFPSYVSTMASSVRESVAGQIPIDLEIKRAESLIQQIEPQVRECQRGLANAEVELESLQASIQELDEVVSYQEKKLRNGMQLLSGGDGREVALASFGARGRVHVDLQRTKDAYVNNAAILKTKRSLVVRQAQAVEAAKQNLFAVHAERETLQDQIRSLKTQQQQVEAMAASSDRFDLDSTALSQAKEVIATVRKRLDVAQRMLENDMIFQGGDAGSIAINERNTLEELEELFGQDRGEVATIEIELPQGR